LLWRTRYSGALNLSRHADSAEDVAATETIGSEHDLTFVGGQRHSTLESRRAQLRDAHECLPGVRGSTHLGYTARMFIPNQENTLMTRARGDDPETPAPMLRHRA
jgi:hypothetical protein